MCVISDEQLRPCPKCGGMVVLLEVPSRVPYLWCTECETVFEPEVSVNKVVADWWNHGSQA